ncbi:terpene cyclase/mutase family protein [Kiritimatiellaeota bacterium B1221]|nr:terpene cyclase/mutase family protein [Kiritimatiellaeota bacterium B1221]
MRPLFSRFHFSLACALTLSLVIPALSAQSISPVLAPHAQDVEAALDNAFEYLLRTQHADGSFDGQYGKSAGVVALAGMSFLAAGHTPGNDRYGSFINDCIDYVLLQQNEDGYILTSGKPDKGMYSHNISTLFLAEVSGMLDPERDVQVRGALEKAIRVILGAQDHKKRGGHEGGWRYSPKATDSDLSVSGWALMSLKAARLNGAMVPEKNIQDAITYVKNRQGENGSLGYQGKGGGRVALSGLGILCLTLTGHHDSPEVQLAQRDLMKRYQKLPKDSHSEYGLYYVTQAAFQLGGDSWEQIGDWLYRTYLPKQKEDGSWSGKTPVYSTSMILLSLTVPYRQLPIYQRDETIDE